MLPRIPGILVALLAVSCGATANPGNESPSRPSPLLERAPAADQNGALASIAAGDLERTVRYLADDQLRGRRTPSAGLDLAADYIAAGFEELGLETVDGAPEYKQTFECGGKGTSANVMGILRGRELAPLIIVSAHYDHLGDRGPGDDTVFNGANDNASGVAAMLLTAQALRKHPARLNGSVLCVAFCGEERGLVGSKFFVENPPFPLAQIEGVLNLEMLGRPLPQDPPVAWVTGHNLSNLHEVFDAAATATSTGFVAASTVGEVEGGAFDRSDNYPFAQAGVVAHTVAAGKIDELYHSVDDEPDALDYPRMAQLVRGVALASMMLADGEAGSLAWTPEGTAAGFGGR